MGDSLEKAGGKELAPLPSPVNMDKQSEQPSKLF